MHIDLSADEATVLAEVLQGALGDLREEVYKSETSEYKDSLRQREAILNGLLARLGAREASPG